MKKVWITEQEWELTLCQDATDKTLELACFYNETGEAATVIIQGATLKYGIPAGGRWYCVLCEDEFVTAFRTIQKEGSGITIRDGKTIQTFHEDSRSWGHETGETVYRGPITLYEDGSVKVDGYRLPVSPAGYPMVQVDGKVGVDCKGHLMIREEDRRSEHKWYPYIMAHDDGQICITADRGIFCRDWRCPEFNGEVVDVRRYHVGFALLTRTGYVYLSLDGRRWVMIEKDVSAIAADGYYVVTADLKGMIRVYEYETELKYAERRMKINRSNKQISEVFIANKKLALKYTDGTFEMGEM
ncbi:MAG: hypothetical protein IJ315_09540 [Firmicutes bacterium]|nr:hypothetical protein [Bacillota bacterium]